MCGFLVSLELVDNSRIKLRGPDRTNVLKVGSLTFVHNLLAITGTPTAQPFVQDDIVCVYNGEIYNQPFSLTDGEVLIPLYKKHGVEFAKQLDGEFAIALYDFRKSIAVFVTDPFKSKPLFINGIQCASYRSCLGGEKARPNEILVKNFEGQVLERTAVRRWDLTQWKTDYEDWLAAFDRAVAKRAKSGCFIGLSSGYDSGGIACALLKQGVQFKAYIYPNGENAEVLEARACLLVSETFKSEANLLEWLAENIDNEPYTILVNGEVVSTRILDDRASLGVAMIAKLARQDGRRVSLSGQGADEIMSDYAPWPDQSSLKGTYPAEQHLWPNFNFSCQESYLMKEEYAAGAFGIENRYPYLDTELVQEFLWLSAEAKNRRYKAPLREYLVRHGFPFEEGVKRGFQIDLERSSRSVS